MFKKVVLVMATLALVAASAGTFSKPNSYKVILSQASVVQGTELKAGEYRIEVAEGKIIISNAGKEVVTVPAKIETVESKYDTNIIRYNSDGGKARISEIRLGGSKTKIVFNP